MFLSLDMELKSRLDSLLTLFYQDCTNIIVKHKNEDVIIKKVRILKKEYITKIENLLLDRLIKYINQQKESKKE